MGAVPATRAPAIHPRRRPATRQPRPAARPAPARRAPKRHTPPAGFAKLPVTAVGRTAGAVSGIADSGLVAWLTRGRAWIALLGVLLGGIVAVNVYGLSLSAQTSVIQTKIDQFERENSVLAGRVDRRSSSGRIQEVASTLGLTAPTPDTIRYLKPAGADAETAGQRLADGSISTDGLFPIVPLDPAMAPPIDPAATIPVTDPATVVPVEPVPVTPDPAVADPAVLAAAPPAGPATTTTPPATDPAYAAPVEGGGVPIP